MRIVKKCDLGSLLLFLNESNPFIIKPLKINYNPYGLNYIDSLYKIYPDELPIEFTNYYETAKAAKRKQDRERRKAEEQRGAEAARRGIDNAGKKMFEVGDKVADVTLPMYGIAKATAEAINDKSSEPVIKEGVKQTVSRIPKFGPVIDTIWDAIELNK